MMHGPLYSLLFATFWPEISLALLLALPIISLCDIFLALHQLPFAGSTNGLCNHVTGTLPAAWGGDGAFPAMTVLEIDITSMTGSLPSAWGGNHSFPALSDLLLTNDVAQVSKLSGTLPESWANPAAFPQLVTLGIGNCNINGMCSSVHALHKWPWTDASCIWCTCTHDI